MHVQVRTAFFVRRDCERLIKPVIIRSIVPPCSTPTWITVGNPGLIHARRGRPAGSADGVSAPSARPEGPCSSGSETNAGHPQTGEEGGGARPERGAGSRGRPRPPRSLGPGRTSPAPSPGPGQFRVGDSRRPHGSHGLRRRATDRSNLPKPKSPSGALGVVGPAPVELPNQLLVEDLWKKVP
jgi:hypothetical protein